MRREVGSVASHCCAVTARGIQPILFAHGARLAAAPRKEPLHSSRTIAPRMDAQPDAAGLVEVRARAVPG